MITKIAKSSVMYVESLLRLKIIKQYLRQIHIIQMKRLRTLIKIVMRNMVHNKIAIVYNLWRVIRSRLTLQIYNGGKVQ